MKFLSALLTVILFLSCSNLSAMKRTQSLAPDEWAALKAAAASAASPEDELFFAMDHIPARGSDSSSSHSDSDHSDNGDSDDQAMLAMPRSKKVFNLAELAEVSPLCKDSKHGRQDLGKTDPNKSPAKRSRPLSPPPSVPAASFDEADDTIIRQISGQLSIACFFALHIDLSGTLTGLEKNLLRCLISLIEACAKKLNTGQQVDLTLVADCCFQVWRIVESFIPQASEEQSYEEMLLGHYRATGEWSEPLSCEMVGRLIAYNQPLLIKMLALHPALISVNSSWFTKLEKKLAKLPKRFQVDSPTVVGCKKAKYALSLFVPYLITLCGVPDNTPKAIYDKAMKFCAVNMPQFQLPQ